MFVVVVVVVVVVVIVVVAVFIGSGCWQNACYRLSTIECCLKFFANQADYTSKRFSDTFSDDKKRFIISHFNFSDFDENSTLFS